MARGNNPILIWILVPVILFLGLAALNTAETNSIRDSPDSRIEITNESINVTSHDTPLKLNNSNIASYVYDEEITARNNTTGGIVEQPGNYTWIQANGTIAFNSSGNYSLGDTALITYGYGKPSNAQNLTKSTTDIPIAFMDMFVWIAFFAMMLAAIMALKRTG